MAGADDRLDLFRGSRKRDDLGHGPMSGQPVALVDAELFGLREDVIAAERAPELGDECGVDSHLAESRDSLYGAQNSSNAPGSAGRASTSTTSPSSIRKRRTWSSSMVRPRRVPRAR